MSERDSLSCPRCGADWQRGEHTADCPQCGGGAMARPCPMCGGRCNRMWQRAVQDSQDSDEAHWIGGCGFASGVKRVIECYRLGGDDRLVREHRLPQISLRQLQELFGLAPPELMYDSYRIGNDQAAFFKRNAGLRFDFERYEYFLSCYAENEAADEETD